MNITGAPGLDSFGQLSRTVSQVRADLSRAATEAVTGDRQDLDRVLGARAGELNLVNKALTDIETNEGRLSLAANRLRQTNAALGAIRQTTAGLGERALTDTVLGGAIGAAETADTARSALAQVVSTLNAGHAGRALFAGDEVDGAAVASANDILSAVEAALVGSVDGADASGRIEAFFAIGGDYDTVVYQGGAGEASAASLGDGSSVRFEAKADDPALRDTLQGLVRLAVLDAVPGDDTVWVEGAASLLKTGEAGLIEIEARGGLAANRVQSTLEANTTERLVLSETREALAGRDAFEAAAEVQRLEIQLEAAYTLTARIARLNFADFIR